MILLEATRRTSRRAVERIRAAFLELDRVAWKNVYPPAEDVYRVVREGPRSFVLVVEDPSL